MLPTIAELIVQPTTLFVANHSGGKDSQAALIALLDRDHVPAKQIVVVHASLGEIEWPGALEHAQQHAKAVGCDFIVARASKTMFDMVRHRHAVRPDAPAWPDAKRRQCTSDLKRNPIEREVRRYAKAHGFTTIVNVLGLRAQESHGRAKRPVFSEVTRFRNKKTGNWVANRPWYEYLPIRDVDELGVFGMIIKAGQQPHEAYSL